MMLCTLGAEDDRWSTMLLWPFDGISMPLDSLLCNNTGTQTHTSVVTNLRRNTAMHVAKYPKTQTRSNKTYYLSVHRFPRAFLPPLVSQQNLWERQHIYYKRVVYRQAIQYTNTSMAIEKNLLSTEYTQKLILNANTNPNPAHTPTNPNLPAKNYN